MNGVEVNTLFQFDVDVEYVESGNKLSKKTPKIIYMSIRIQGHQFTVNITLHILNDDGDPVDIHGQKIIINLELKQL